MILGLDFDTRAVHAVLLDDDTNAARYVPLPIADKTSTFEAARNVRLAMRPLWSEVDPLEVTAAGIEKPFSSSRATAYSYGLVTGAILNCLPRGLPVYMLPVNKLADAGGWKALTVGKTNASKPEIARWAFAEIQDARGGSLEHASWPQDAFDAYCIARAARTVDERTSAAA